MTTRNVSTTSRAVSAAIALAWTLLCAGAARAQYMVNPDRLSPALRNMEWRPDDQQLNCSVSAVKPALNFGFRFQAGFIVRVPMNQYRGKGHRWNILARVTPEGGKPVYFLSRYNLPEVPKTNTELEVGGGYLIGEGRYKVAWKLQDETGRVCRRQWTFQAKRSRSESKVRVAMEPDTVAGMSAWVAGGARRATDDAPPIRLTVLMHAAPTSPRRARMNVRDRLMLISILSSLLERVPTTSVRVVVFNLDQQKELYREDNFRNDGFNEVAQALDGLELGLVDYQVLQNRRGHVELLADLMNREVNTPQPSDIVLFLGPMSRFYDKMPDSVAKATAVPRFFYFQYRGPATRMQSTFPDVISSAVSRLKGKTVVIHSPGDFAKGIEQIENRVR